jgi:hypothetical protein
MEYMGYSSYCLMQIRHCGSAWPKSELLDSSWCKTFISNFREICEVVYGIVVSYIEFQYL